MSGAVNDQLRYRLASRWCVEDAPDAVTGGDLGGGDIRYGANQR